MVQPALSEIYDEHYFRTYRGGPYARGLIWREVFEAMASGIVREINPGSLLDVGCAFGLLVEALREKLVDAWGMDVSSYAIDQVRDEVKPFCWQGSILDPLPRRYDLVTCFEVLEHLPQEDAARAVRSICDATDDVLFSSSPDDYAEDTHLNVRPIEYWTELFARHGFIRDVDFDPNTVGRTPAVRFRKSGEPLHRIVAGYDRRLAALAAENGALRTRALETKQLMAQQETKLRDMAASHPEVAALEATVAEQEQHLDALNERLEFMSDRETELRSMLVDAHNQLLQRDESFGPLRMELEARGNVIQDLQRVIDERTAWAERMVAEAEQRGALLEQLQQALNERAEQLASLQRTVDGQNDQTASLQRLVHERTEWAESLQRAVDERTAWAERMVAEAEQRGLLLEQLSAQLEASAARVDAGRSRTGRLRSLAGKVRRGIFGR
jgi:hypothetical protein